MFISVIKTILSKNSKAIVIIWPAPLGRVEWNMRYLCVVVDPYFYSQILFKICLYLKKSDLVKFFYIYKWKCVCATHIHTIIIKIERIKIREQFHILMQISSNGKKASKIIRSPNLRLSWMIKLYSYRSNVSKCLCPRLFDICRNLLWML